MGFTHLQFEALLTAASESSGLCDFVLVTMLQLLGLRMFEGTGADIADLGEEHGHRVLPVLAKGHQGCLDPAATIPWNRSYRARLVRRDLAVTAALFARSIDRHLAQPDLKTSRAAPTTSKGEVLSDGEGQEERAPTRLIVPEGAAVVP